MQNKAPYILENCKQALKHPMLFLSLLVISISLNYIINIPYLTQFEQPHYISISWFMRQYHNWLILYDSAGVYLSKPPLLFWLINLTWHFFGLNTWIFRILPMAAVLGTMWLLFAIFKQLWPNYATKAWTAAALFLGSWYTMHYIPLFLFDMPLVFFITLSLFGLIRLIKNKCGGFILFMLANGLGLLIKGPIILLYTGIPAYSAGFLLKLPIRHIYYLSLISASLFGGLVIGCAWLLPVLLFLYKQHMLMTLIKPILKLHHLFGHRPWWFYIVKLPLLLLPWTLWPSLYRAVYYQFKQSTHNPWVRWLAISSLIIFILMSFIPAKSSRYLLPIIIYLALLLAYCLQNGLDNKHFIDRNTFTIPILIQCFLVFLLVTLNAIGPEKSNLHAKNIQQFMTCVQQYWNKPDHPKLAYQYRYAGYWFNINSDSLPAGIILKSKRKLNRWAHHNPQGLIILENQSDVVWPKLKKICEVNIIPTFLLGKVDQKHKLHLMAMKVLSGKHPKLTNRPRDQRSD